MTDTSEIRNTSPSKLIPSKRSVEDPIEYDKEIKIHKVNDAIEIKEVESNGENNNQIQNVVSKDISEEVEEISVEEGLSIGNNYQQPVPGDDEQNDEEEDEDDGEDLEIEATSGEDSFGDSDEEDDSGLEEVEFANSNNDDEEEEEDDDVEIVGETENGVEKNFKNQKDTNGKAEDVSESTSKNKNGTSKSEAIKKLLEENPINLHSLLITKELCAYARSYLKSEGYVQFLDKFVPSAPTFEDIIMLTKLLGYVPNIRMNKHMNNEEDEEEFLMKKAVLFLQKAINKVLKMRTRLPNFNEVEHLMEKINKASNIILLTGAGISTSLGIPDFRSSQGIYSQVRHFGLDDPQDVFSLELFKEDPEIFYSVAHMILPPDGVFTPLHGFIKLLEEKGKLLRNYTQNIDNLEGSAGVSAEKIIQCHGSFATATCITCKYKVPGHVLYANLRNKQIAYCPFCANERKNLLKKLEKYEDEDNGSNWNSRFFHIKSFGVMKPDITFFGEGLPIRFHSTIKDDLKECDLLICIGTSLKVAPVSDIVNMLPENVPQVLINKDLISHAEFDICLLGYCDQAITWFCNKLNWEIKHKDFEKISNSGLECETLDETFGIYEITDSKQREALRVKKEEEEEEEKEKEASSEAVAATAATAVAAAAAATAAAVAELQPNLEDYSNKEAETESQVKEHQENEVIEIDSDVPTPV
ncbi:hypothetical protein B5S33_g398 [[Candida] boidinii]|nr:hypothetical protein B5S33_g398 [[Candida] boidinii]